MITFAHHPHFHGNCAPYSLNKSLEGGHSLSGCCGRGKILLPLPGIEPRFLWHPVYSLVAILTALSWLSKLVVHLYLSYFWHSLYDFFFPTFHFSLSIKRIT